MTDRQSIKARRLSQGVFRSGDEMKSLPVLVLMVVGALMSGCVAYEVPYRDGDGHQRDHRWDDRDRVPPRADHDRDGVSDRQDRYPNDPRRY